MPVENTGRLMFVLGSKMSLDRLNGDWCRDLADSFMEYAECGYIE